MPYVPYSTLLIQAGAEATNGTAVPATSIWPVEPSEDLRDARNRRKQKINIGAAAPYYRYYDSYFGGRLVIPKHPAFFEHSLWHILEAGIGRPAAVGAGTTYNRNYALPIGSTANAIIARTLEAGTAQIPAEQFRMAFGFVEEFELSGQAGPDGDVWMIGATWHGARKLANALTAALELPAALEAPMFGESSFYIDNSGGGTIGTTLLSNILVNASIKVKTGLVPVPAANGLPYYNKIKYTVLEDPITFTLEVELEDDLDVVQTERAAWAADAVRLIRIIGNGSSAAKKFTLDMAAKYSEEPSAYKNTNGNATVTLTGTAQISPDDSLYWALLLTNSVQTPV